MDWILNQISQVEVGNLMAFAGMLWIFKTHLDKKFENIEKRFEKIEQTFDKIELRFQKIDQTLSDLDKRLVAIETTLRIQGGCRLNYEHNEKSRVD